MSKSLAIEKKPLYLHPRLRNKHKRKRSKKTIKIFKIYCGVEQLVARWAHNPKVARSSRVPATTKRRIKNWFSFFRFKAFVCSIQSMCCTLIGLIKSTLE